MLGGWRLCSSLLAVCSLVMIPFGQPIGQTGGEESAQRISADGQRDFDFEFGAWDVRLSRLSEPLTGSGGNEAAWLEYRGQSVVRKVWNGRANLGEIEVEGPSGRIQGLSLRLYNPQSQQWYISWANSRDAALGEPMVGGFATDGRGLFYGEEMFDGRAIFVRFIFSDITDRSFRLEQAFSADGGESWEPNWIARFERETGADEQ